MTTPGAIRAAELQYAYWRRFKLAALVGMFLHPLLYLGAMGLGVGALVDNRQAATASLGGLSYLAFIGPGVLVTSAMMSTTVELMWPVMGGFRWERSYHSMAATALTSGQIVHGVALYTALRGALAATGVAAVLALFDDTRNFGLLGAIPAGVLTGSAVGLPICAWVATRERDVSLPTIMRFGIFPMFLLGGTFFPMSQLPRAAEIVARLTPVYHGIELARGAVAGGLDAGAAVAHVAVLVAFVVAGLLASRITFARQLYR